jgi:sulfur dioxygenase
LLSAGYDEMVQTKVPGVKSIISKASGARADVLIDPGEKIFIGNLFLEVGEESSPL